MTKPVDPWKAIAIPADRNMISAQRAEHPLNFFRGRDSQGNYLFWLEVSLSSESDNSPVELPQFTGMDVTRERFSAGKWRLLLSLADREAGAIFTALCFDLLDATMHLEPRNSEAGMHTVLGRLDRWHRLFRQARDRILSRPEQIGLAGELLFLTDVVMAHQSELQAIESWRGPLGTPQDFSLPHASAEVKSGDRADVHISSEFQLDTLNGPIVLVNQVLKEASSSGSQDTLFAIVQRVKSKVLGSETAGAIDKLSLLLLEVGYTEREEYDQIPLTLSDRYYFRVDREFPCINTSHTGTAISNVQYKLKLNQCEPWRISEAQAIEILMGESKDA